MRSCPNHLQHLHGPCTKDDVEKSGGEVSFGNVWIADLDFADDVFIFAKTTEVLAEAFDSLSEEVGPLGLPLTLPVSRIKTKVQTFLTS